MKSRVAGSLMLSMAVAVGLAACAGGGDRQTLAEQEPVHEPATTSSDRASNATAPQPPAEARAAMAQAAGQKQTTRSAMFARENMASMMLPPRMPPAAPFNREGYEATTCPLYTSPTPRDSQKPRMPPSA